MGRMPKNRWDVERTRSILNTLEEEGPLVPSKENKDTGSQQAQPSGTHRVISGRIQWRYSARMNQSLEIGQLSEWEACSPQQPYRVSGWNSSGVTDAHEWGQALHGKGSQQVYRFQRGSHPFCDSTWRHALHALYLRWYTYWVISSNPPILSLPNQSSEKEPIVADTIHLHLTPNRVE